jgi:shikimate kinase
MTKNVVNGTRFFIVGFMGVGKSTVGRGVAKRLDVPFYDLDEEIEQDMGKKIHEIFDAVGEGSFRAIETERLREIVKREPGVIATGGGTFTRLENREIIGSSGVSVWLDAPTEVVIERGARGRHRPLWQSTEQVRTLLDERLADYSKADIRFDMNALPLAKVTARLANVLQSYCES